MPAILAGLCAFLLLLAVLPFVLFGPVSAAELGFIPPMLREDIGEFIFIEPGEFTMGGNGNNALSEQTVFVPGFHIDKYEVTNAAYQIFTEETGHSAPWSTYPTEKSDHPVTNVTWEDAQTFCQWAGKRLPTEAEWERAARGKDNRIYPWGDQWASNFSNTRETNTEGTMPVGSYPAGFSANGVGDLAGNVWEWVDAWSDNSQSTRVIRGGAWNAIRLWADSSARNAAPPNSSQSNLGFRCAR